MQNDLIRTFAPLLPALAVPYLVWHFLMAAPLYMIAEQRKLWWKWLAWLPIGQNYVMGAIADDIGSARSARIYLNGEEYRKETYFRYVLSGYQLLFAFAAIVIGVRVLQGAGMPQFLTSDAFVSIQTNVWPVLSFALMGVHAWCLYKIFGYYRADRASLYTFLSVILYVPTPFLLLSLRKEFPQKPKG